MCISYLIDKTLIIHSSVTLPFEGQHIKGILLMLHFMSKVMNVAIICILVFYFPFFTQSLVHFRKMPCTVIERQLVVCSDKIHDHDHENENDIVEVDKFRFIISKESEMSLTNFIQEDEYEVLHTSVLEDEIEKYKSFHNIEQDILSQSLSASVDWYLENELPSPNIDQESFLEYMDKVLNRSYFHEVHPYLLSIWGKKRRKFILPMLINRLWYKIISIKEHFRSAMLLMLQYLIKSNKTSASSKIRKLTT